MIQKANLPTTTTDIRVVVVVKWVYCIIYEKRAKNYVCSMGDPCNLYFFYLLVFVVILATEIHHM